MYTVTLLSTDTLTRGSQALRTSMDDTWMSTVQLLVVVISRDNPWMYTVTLSSTETLTRVSQALRTSMDDTWISTVATVISSGGIQG